MLQLLLLGNSYTFYNDLDRVLADALDDGGHAAEATRLAEGGYRFVDHLAQTEVVDSAWEDALVSPGGTWDWVILQEQSQIPGFPHSSSEWRDSLAAGGALDDLAEGQGADTVLFMTWGRRLGDPDNPDLYPDYRAMQDALADGYLSYATDWSTDERPVWVAPVGWAWEAVSDHVLADGMVPEDDGTLFSNLYNADGSHPSPLGTWLIACVFYATLTGDSPAGLAVPDGLPVQDAETVRDLAGDLVLHTELGLTYPWGSPSTDTDPTETDDTGPDDTATPVDSGTPTDETGPLDTDQGTGCGCAVGTGGRAGLPAAGLLLLLAGRRRYSRTSASAPPSTTAAKA